MCFEAKTKLVMEDIVSVALPKKKDIVMSKIII